MSKLEESLAQVLDFAARDQNAPWPYPPPIREMHPFWCCEHAKKLHIESLKGETFVCVSCAIELDGDTRAAHRYDKGRGFRFDFAWPSLMVAVECEGVVYGKQGRHQTGVGFARDLEKYSAARLAGWDVIRVSQREITSGVALQLIEKALAAAAPLPVVESK